MCAVHKNTTLMEINAFIQWPINNECRLPWVPDTSMARLGMTLLFWLLGSLIAGETLRAVRLGRYSGPDGVSTFLLPPLKPMGPRICALDGVVSSSPGGSGWLRCALIDHC